MKKYLTIFTAIFGFMNLLHAQDLSPAIAFAERVYNFGTILEKNGNVSHTFVFQNTGKTPVVINDVHSGCGCISKVVSKGPVPPGKKGEVTITFNPEYKSGFFSKEIVVLSNNGQHYNRIWVEGTITPVEHPIEDDYPYNFGNGLHLRLKVMAFGYLKPGESRQMELHYANATDKEMTLNFATLGNRDGLYFTSPGKIAAKARGVIKFAYAMPLLTSGDMSIKVYPYVDGKKLNEPIEIKILDDSKAMRKSQVKKN